MLVDKKLMKRVREKKFLFGEIMQVARHSVIQREEVKQLIINSDFIDFLERRPWNLQLAKYHLLTKYEKLCVEYFDRRREARDRIYCFPAASLC